MASETPMDVIVRMVAFLALGLSIGAQCILHMDAGVFDRLENLERAVQTMPEAEG